jgi:hypothetical protein
MDRLLSHILSLVQCSRILLEDKMCESLLRRKQRTIHNRSWILNSELLSTLNRSRSQEFLFIVPYGRGSSLPVPILLFDIAGVRRTKKLKQVQFKLSGIQFAEYRVDIVLLRVSLLKHDHAIEKLHVSAPARNGLQSLLSVAHFRKEFEPLVPLSLGLT